MTPLFERLDQEEAVVHGELATLREKVAVAEERLAHLTITRETLLSLGGEDCVNQDDATQQALERPQPSRCRMTLPLVPNLPMRKYLPVGPPRPSRWSGKWRESGCWCCWRGRVGR